MRRNGFTLIEVLVAGVLLSAALAMIWSAWLNVEHTGQVLEKRMTASTTTTHGVAEIQRELRHASRASIEIVAGDEIRYRVMEAEGDGGLPLNAEGEVMLSDVRRILVDREDLNDDGVGASQLLCVRPDGVTVLANGLAQDDGAAGVSFVKRGDGIEVALRAQSKTYRKHIVGMTGSTTIYPRNP